MNSAANRILLALTGLVLLALGGSVLAVGLGVTPPSWWIHQGSHDVLLTRHERTRWQGTDWWWPTVFAALGVLVLAALWWLASVLRTRRLNEVLVDTGDGEEAQLRGRALADALSADASGLDGVAHAEAFLTGRPDRPATRLRLQLAAYASPGDTLHRLTRGALTAARDSVRLERLPAEVQFRAVRHKAQRVV
jgi:hypothetical protein